MKHFSASWNGDTRHKPTGGVILGGAVCVLPIFLFATAVIGQMQTIGIGETFAVAKLSAKEIGEIITAIEPSAFDTPDSWQKELRVRRVDLGARPGIVVRGTRLLCGATGNCQIWVFRKVNGKWVSLFEGDAPLAEGFQLGPTSTNGIKDFSIAANLSAESAKRTTYKFDGKVYRAGP